MPDFGRGRLGRIDDSGFIRLTMEDIRSDVSFEDAGANDIRGTREVSYRARVIHLCEGERVRILKDTTGTSSVKKGSIDGD